MRPRAHIPCIAWMMFLVLMPVLFSCRHDDDVSLHFIGDSIIERWDLSRYFPAFITTNHGLSNSGISYIEEHSGKFGGHRVVLLTGINDLSRLPVTHDPEVERQQIADYHCRYVAAVSALSADRIYIFSVLLIGEEHSSQAEALNQRIHHFNTLLRQSAHNHGWTYLDVESMLADGSVLNPAYSLDGLHPNDACYEVLTNQVIRLL